MTLPLRRLNLWATCSPVFFSDGAVHPFDDHEREDNVEPAGRDTFQAKTVRNREAVSSTLHEPHWQWDSGG